MVDLFAGNSFKNNEIVLAEKTGKSGQTNFDYTKDDQMVFKSYAWTVNHDDNTVWWAPNEGHRNQKWHIEYAYNSLLIVNRSWLKD